MKWILVSGGRRTPKGERRREGAVGRSEERERLKEADLGRCIRKAAGGSEGKGRGGGRGRSQSER